jgi:hypothetical protein
MVRVWFDGRSYELSATRLGVGTRSSDLIIKQRVARHLEVGVDRLVAHRVDRFGRRLWVRPDVWL